MKYKKKKKIKDLEEELNDYKKKCSTNELSIKELKDNIALIEEMKKIDPLKLKQFDYNKLKVIERDPAENVNSKILLLQSLIEESNNKIKMYKESITAFNDKLKELGYDSINFDNVLNNNGDMNINVNINDADGEKNNEKANNNKDNNNIESNNSPGSGDNNENSASKAEKNKEIGNASDKKEKAYQENENEKSGTT